jgi:hypothetical protein
MLPAWIVLYASSMPSPLVMVLFGALMFADMVKYIASKSLLKTGCLGEERCGRCGLIHSLVIPFVGSGAAAEELKKVAFLANRGWGLKDVPRRIQFSRANVSQLLIELVRICTHYCT